MSSDAYCMECKNLGIKIIDRTVNVDHVHFFVKCPLNYPMIFITKRMKTDMWANMIRIYNTIRNFS